jgi:uncharacterized protein YndB with AHSA1/START domain
MPDATYTVERSAVIPARPQRVFDLVAGFHEWRRWSPWEDVDPSMSRTYSGADAGIGAVYEWSGNRKAGRGRMEIVEAAAPSHVAIALDFVKPLRSSNTTTFTFTPEGDGTRVLWSMTGPRPLLMRVFGFLFDMEKLVGRDFEKGLTRLRAAATSTSTGPA